MFLNKNYLSFCAGRYDDIYSLQHWYNVIYMHHAYVIRPHTYDS